jgi:hypothetical protein
MVRSASSRVSNHGHEKRPTVEIAPKKGYLTVIWPVLARPNRAIRSKHFRGWHGVIRGDGISY